MLLPAIKKNKFPMNKKGISIVIGYVLLIAVSIVMSILVYQWLKTYVPSETLECPEGTSVFIKETNYDCINKILTIKLQNNGKFSLAGYFIHVSTSPDTESLATINIFSKITEGGTPHGNSIVYDLSINSLTPDSPNNVQTSSFDVLGYDTLTEVEIIPTRFQQEDNKNRYLSCSNEKVRETLKC